jgi:hypothetical protein
MVIHSYKWKVGNNWVIKAIAQLFPFLAIIYRKWVANEAREAYGRYGDDGQSGKRAKPGN